MRSTGIIGLNNNAEEFLKHNTHIAELENESGFGFSDPFDDEVIYRFRVFYDSIKQMVLYEKEEAAPWSSGPDVYTFLMYLDGTIVEESKWFKPVEETNGHYCITSTDGRVVCLVEGEPSSWSFESGEFFN